MNIEQLHSHTSGSTTAVTIYQRVETLVVQAATDGVLTREEETAIVTAITRSGRPTAAVCRLYRLLQEQVWDGELLLDRPRDR
jgi:hypothetical protein